jgi:pimeloyl-ACP methyl ester carboxylesterase
MSHSLLGVVVSTWLAASTASVPDPPPRGTLVHVGTRRLHLYCTGAGSPTVVIETGFGDFSFDWALVQDRVAARTRVCTYDRGGYAWSDLGPEPRTFDQLNLELHLALAAAGERGPLVLVGQSFGGGPVRNYALRYRSEVGGLVLLEAVGDTQYITMGREAQQLRTFARGRPIPEPRVDTPLPEPESDVTTARQDTREPLDPAYNVLPLALRRLHEWASRKPSVQRAEDGLREWSPEYFARWAQHSQAGLLGKMPLVVLARARGGYPDGLNRPVEELETARLDSQRALAAWSQAGELRVVDAGHNIHLEAPSVAADAILTVVARVRRSDR